MKISTLSIFPDLIANFTSESMLKRAQDKGLVEFSHIDLRDYTHDVHKSVDDEPYGGGAGQLMTAPPFFEALDDIRGLPTSPSRSELSSPEQLDKGDNPYIIALSPIGQPFTQSIAQELSTQDHLLLLCGHYEGFDERIYALADKVISIGDYVLTGGELPACVLIDSIVRLLPGVLGNAESTKAESFNEDKLEYPQYTRPAEYRGMLVPDVLLSGNHRLIEQWRQEQSAARTKSLRPDL